PVARLARDAQLLDGAVERLALPVVAGARPGVVAEDAVAVPERAVAVEVRAVRVEEPGVEVEPAPLLDVPGQRQPHGAVALAGQVLLEAARAHRADHLL